MVQTQEVIPERRVRRWRSISEKRQIVQLRLKPGASVAEVARAHGVNANQVFKWRRAFERGELIEPCTALLPVTVTTPSEPENDVAQEPRQEQEPRSGAIHIEFPGGGDDQRRKKIWIAAGLTDMRRGVRYEAVFNDCSNMDTS